MLVGAPSAAGDGDGVRDGRGHDDGSGDVNADKPLVGLDIADELQTSPVNGSDEALGPPIVSDRRPGGSDPAGECAVRHEPVAPDRIENLGSGTEAVAVGDQVTERLEDLRFDRYPLTSDSQFERRGVELGILETKDHLVSIVDAAESTEPVASDGADGGGDCENGEADHETEKQMSGLGDDGEGGGSGQGLRHVDRRAVSYR